MNSASAARAVTRSKIIYSVFLFACIKFISRELVVLSLQSQLAYSFVLPHRVVV